MLDLSVIAVEPELAEEGVWMPYMGGSFLLARPGPAYQQRLVELASEHWDLINSKTPEGEAKAIEVTTRAFAEVILKDWKDVGDKGVALEYTPELGFALLMDKRQFELRNQIDMFVNNRTNYQHRVNTEVAETVKDSAVS